MRLSAEFTATRKAKKVVKEILINSLTDRLTDCATCGCAKQSSQNGPCHPSNCRTSRASNQAQSDSNLCSSGGP
jgi:hypothetical protein